MKKYDAVPELTVDRVKAIVDELWPPRRFLFKPTVAQEKDAVVVVGNGWWLTAQNEKQVRREILSASREVS